MNAPLVEGVDYYLEDGRMVFTSLFLLKRGYCCNSGCRHCPYRAAEPGGDPAPDGGPAPETLRIVPKKEEV